MLSGMRTSTEKGAVTTVLCSVSSVVRIALWCVLVGMVLGVALGYQAAAPSKAPVSHGVSVLSVNGQPSVAERRCVDHADSCDHRPPRRVAAVVRALT